MKKIGIFSETWLTWDENSKGLGGSETWILEFGSFLRKNGYDVTVYSSPFSEHTAENGMVFKNYSDYEGEYFDVAVISRICKDYFSINSNNKILISHDICLWDFNEDMYNDKDFCGIGVLSEWAKNFFIKICPFVKEEDIFLFSNGYNEELYKDADGIERENAMVWSSQPERGLDFLLEKVLPLIKEKIPDFKVYFCYPNYASDTDKYMSEDVIFKGSLSKEELSSLQKKCKVWIYPNLGKRKDDDFFFETFCITALENAMAGNIVVTNDAGGLSTTLRGYDFMERYVPEKIDDTDGYARVLAEKAVLCMTDSTAYSALRKSLYEICRGKTWHGSNTELLSQIKRIVYVKNADIVLFEENGKDVDKDKVMYAVRKALKNGNRLINVFTNDKNNLYGNSLNNGHHYTTDFFYGTVYPLLRDMLCIKESLTEDFYRIEDMKDDGDFSFMYPKKEKEFVLKYGKMEHLDGNTIHLMPTEIECGYNFLYGKQLNGVDYRNNTNYHRLFCLSHYPCSIENRGCNNGKALLISGDSHIIPLLPILAYYFRKIVYLDNRDYITYRWLWEDEEFDRVILCMGNSSYHGLKYYIEHNFE